MGIFGAGGDKQDEQSPEEAGAVDLAFVLLGEPQLPSVKDIIQSYHDFAPQGDELSEMPADEDEEPEDDSSGDRILSLQFESGENAFVALVPVPVPNDEADEGATYSVSSLGTGWELQEHGAHLIVTTLSSDAELSVIDRLHRFTSLLAAVAKASQALAIYWGHAGATHEAEFFQSIATEPDVVPRIMLWTGISVAREPDGRLSLLSLGMRQLDLPDLLLVVDESAQEEALETFFDLLSYVVNHGSAPPEGDTVGRTAQQRLAVHYVPSPIDPQKQVWRVELA